MKLNSIILLYKIIVLNSHYKYSRCVPSCPLNSEDTIDPPCVANIAYPLTITTFKIPKFNYLMSEWYKTCKHIRCNTTCKYYGTSNSHCGVQEGIKKLINQ